VVREDDVRIADYGGQSLIPDADPYGDFRRVFNHFYDPVNNRALEFSAPCNAVGGTPCNRSIDWAIGVADSQAPVFNPSQTRRNHFSWGDAREAFWRALTYKSGVPSGAGYAERQAQDSGIRRNFWNSGLKNIGHVAHLLQDAAQPQHTRNDRHNDRPWVAATSIARRTMEAYTNYRVTGNALSAPNDEQQELRDMYNAPTGARLLSVPPIGIYPIPQFNTVLKYFTTRVENVPLAQRRGLADYSNRGFYSEGTLPRLGSEYTSPPIDISDPGFSIIESADYLLPGYGILTGQKLLWPVPDPVAPSYADTCRTSGKLQILSVSEFSESTDLSTGMLVRRGLLALDDYQCHQDALLPRAIAYSAGLINFFFRGELEIAAPPQRLLAALDQGVAHTIDVDGYPRRSDNNGIFGFQKVRLRVRNITPDIVESGGGNTYTQVLGGSDGPSSGRMVAVARYHRNPCYKPDMTGERRVRLPLNGTFQPPSGCPVAGSRTRYQEISVSAEIPVAPGEFGFGPSSTFVDKTFDFAADPIPVNATDLFIQVVYRGPLGAEPDGVALGTYDAREPMFVTWWNNTDYYNQNGAWASSGGGIFRKGAKDFQFCVSAGADRVILVRRMNATTGQAAMQFPEPAEFMRIAVIAAKPVTTENVTFRGNVSFFDPQPPVVYVPRVTGIKGTINQANKELIDEVTLPFPLPADPLADCPVAPPVGTAFLWCVEPIRVRRGLAGGKVDEAIYLDNTSGGAGAPDPGTLPNFVQTPIQRSGENLWDQEPLIACPVALTEIPPDLPEILSLEEELAGRGPGSN